MCSTKIVATLQRTLHTFCLKSEQLLSKGRVSSWGWQNFFFFEETDKSADYKSTKKQVLMNFLIAAFSTPRVLFALKSHFRPRFPQTKISMKIAPIIRHCRSFAAEWNSSCVIKLLITPNILPQKLLDFRSFGWFSGKSLKRDRA